MRTHLASLVEDFRHHAGETAVVNHRGIRSFRTSYGALAELAGRFAAELDRRGIAAGDRVVLWGANSPEWMAAFFGCLLRGAIAVPLDFAGSPEFAQRVARDVMPKLLVGDRDLLQSLIASEAVETEFLILAELPAALPEQPQFAVSQSVGPQTPFQIVFTSGTTSEPKGIVHTHRNVLASVEPIEREIAKFRRVERLFHPLRFLHTLPLSHVFGQFMGMWLPGILAAEVHFVEQFEARRMTELIRRERISVLVAVPRVLQLVRIHLLSHFPGLAEKLVRTKGHPKLTKWWRFRRVHDLLGWKFWAVISGGAALPTELEEFWSGIGIPVIQGYGMTETTALVTLNYPFKISAGSIGKTLPGREVRLSEEGEILVRGEMLATATWAGGKMRPREGEWLATGDLGETNERGELRFLGRKDDVIVTGGGLNVHPADLEAALKKQPAIRECVVVPCETASGTEAVAVAILASNEDELPQAVQNANRELAAFQQIRRILLWPEPQFPYTSTGKLLRRKVTAWVAQELGAVAGRQNDAQAAANGHGKDVLLDLIAEMTGEHPSAGGDHLRLTEDLLLDSLGRVQLQTALEQRLGVAFADDAFANLATLGELRGVLSAETARGVSAAPRSDSVGDAGVKAANGFGAASHQDHFAEQAPVQFAAADPPPGRSKDAEDDLQALTSQRMYPRWPWNWFFAPLRAAFLEVVARPLTWLLGAPRVVVRASAIPNGPLIVIANHVSAYDGALVLYALPHNLRRRLAIAMSGEMLLDYRRGRNQGNWFLNLAAPPQYWMVTAFFNVFPLARRHGFRKSFQHAGEAMDRGYNVLIFPEGARHFEGGMRPFRAGIGLIAQESRVPVLPVALLGLQQMHREGRWFRSGKLEIRIGEPIYFDSSTEPSELTALFESAVRQLFQ